MPDSLACRIYVLVVLIETAIDLAIEGDLLIRINAANDIAQGQEVGTVSKKMPVYLAIFSLAQCVILSSIAEPPSSPFSINAAYGSSCWQ
jgi:hypothetical protein